MDILSQLKGKEFDCPSLENKAKCPLHLTLLEDVQDGINYIFSIY